MPKINKRDIRVMDGLFHFNVGVAEFAINPHQLNVSELNEFISVSIRGLRPVNFEKIKELSRGKGSGPVFQKKRFGSSRIFNLMRRKLPSPKGYFCYDRIKYTCDGVVVGSCTGLWNTCSYE